MTRGSEWNGSLWENLPPRVILREVGPRDGLQMEKQVVPTSKKIALIQGLAKAGFTEIQVASFVHPQKVPQMADADELCRLLPEEGGVSFMGLALNRRGARRAVDSGLDVVEASISASDAHSRKNAGLSHGQALDSLDSMLDLVEPGPARAWASIQCSFGCALEGPVPIDRVVAAARRALAHPLEVLCLADTTGMATPKSIRDMLEQILALTPAGRLSLHLHDTRGLGLVNLLAALSMGVTRFDVSFGGMGGCPFVPGAAGNIAAEDTAYFLESLGVATGIDARAVAALSREMESFLGHPLPAKLARVPGPPRD